MRNACRSRLAGTLTRRSLDLLGESGEFRLSRWPAAVFDGNGPLGRLDLNQSARGAIEYFRIVSTPSPGAPLRDNLHNGEC